MADELCEKRRRGGGDERGAGALRDRNGKKVGRDDKWTLGIPAPGRGKYSGTSSFADGLAYGLFVLSYVGCEQQRCVHGD
mgnify:CR=1 FL=1